MAIRSSVPLLRSAAALLGLLAVMVDNVAGVTMSHDLVVTRVFDAPVDRVWAAWRDPQAVMAWWGPTGFTVPVAEMDFREGGTSLVCMRAADGPDLCNSWTYRKIVPMESIAFDLGWVDRDGNRIDPASVRLPPDIPKVVPHLITFRTLDGDRTEMTVTEYGYPSQELVAMSKAGLEQVLDKLAASLVAPDRP